MDRCRRKIHRSKRERCDPAVTEWWFKLFKYLENKASIPWINRYEIIWQTIPAHIIDKIYYILEIEDFSVHNEDEIVKVEEVTKQPSLQASIVYKNTSSSSRKIDYGPKLQPNPYLKFFKIDSGKPPPWKLTLDVDENLHLTLYADMIATRIATRFVKWVNQFTPDDPINIKSIADMFNLRTENESYVRNRLQEIFAVPVRTAQYTGEPWMAREVVLHREIKSDLKIAKAKTKLTAFGRTLPEGLQVRPKEVRQATKWLRCRNIPKNLETMSTVWKGITNLKATREYCKFLHNVHPEITPPKYLTEVGLMEPKAFMMKSCTKISD